MGKNFITKLFMLLKCPEQVKKNSIIIQQTTGLIRQVLWYYHGVMQLKGFSILTFEKSTEYFMINSGNNKN